MTTYLVPLWTALLLGAEPIETRFAQVAPVRAEATTLERSAGQARAVVLVHGLRAHPFSSTNVAKAEWHSWQKPGSALVKSLAQEADVYAFAYSQDVAVDDVAGCDGLAEGICRLSGLGYKEIVLVGHSAGGIVVRQFVEDHPDAGVTKVVQVCAPNGGSSWGKATIGVRRKQEPFLTSLTKECRQQCLTKRSDKKIPEQVEFVCLIGHLHFELSVAGTLDKGDKPQTIVASVATPRGDGVVSSGNQWSQDLQDQGVPVVAMELTHFSVMRSTAGMERIAQLVRARQPRWTAAEVAAARTRLLGAKD